MQLDDFSMRIEYFHGASDEHLRLLGVDRRLLPEPAAWATEFERDLGRPLGERASYGVVWELDGSPIGFSTSDGIELGVEARMHLHIVDPDRRGQGCGARLVGLTAEHYCEVLSLRRLFCEPHAFNAAPNRTLQRAGFRYVCSRQTQPGPINLHQTTTVWVYHPPGALTGAHDRATPGR